MAQTPLDDEPNLKALGDLLRDDEPEQSALDRLADGTLPAAELEALRQQAQRDPRLAAALEAYAPLDADVKQRIGALFAANAANAANKRVRFLPNTRVWLAAAGVAAVAALAVFSVRERTSGTLPEYTLTARPATPLRAERPAREEPLQSGATLITAPGTQLQLWLRPERAVNQAVNARTFLRRDERCEPWPSTTEVAAGGAVRIELSPFGGQLPPSAALVVVLGEAATLGELACDQAAKEPSVRRWILPLRAAP